MVFRTFSAHFHLLLSYQGRRASRLPLAIIFRAFGAPYPGYHISRLRRSVPWLSHFAALVQINYHWTGLSMMPSSSRYNFLQSDYSLWRLRSLKTIGSQARIGTLLLRPKGTNNA